MVSGLEFIQWSNSLVGQSLKGQAMKLPKEMYQMKMYQMAKHLGVLAEPIALFENKYLYRVKNYRYYDDNLVIPEFYNLMHIPFYLSLSINFLTKLPKVSESEKPRRKVINGLLRYINAQVLEKYPSLKSGRRTVRAAWVIEYGDLKTPEEEERHAHILLHFDKVTPCPVPVEIMRHLKSLDRKRCELLGISDLDVQMIAGQQAECVSYFCKIERGREFKVVEYSPNFKKVVERLFVPQEEISMKKAA
jgi:hypothetical protein